MLKSCIFYGLITNALHVFASVHQQRAERKYVYTVLYKKTKKKSAAPEKMAKSRHRVGNL